MRKGLSRNMWEAFRLSMNSRPEVTQNPYAERQF